MKHRIPLGIDAEQSWIPGGIDTDQHWIPGGIDADRRDSGLSPSTDESDSYSSTFQREDTTDNDHRDSGDSGVGSPSPHSSIRSFGRRYTRMEELRKLRAIQTAIENLSAALGGEVVFTYKPRLHPNLPSLASNEMKLMIPGKAVDRQNPDPLASSHPGYFLSRTGLSTKDIIEKRLPCMPSGGLAVISNGLAIDLYRLTDTNTDMGPLIVKYIFHFLELDFPPVLLTRAMDITLQHIGRNVAYVDKCTNKEEAVNFLFSPFVMPEEVTEMASVMEDLDQDFETVNERASETEREHVRSVEPSDSHSDSYIVCGINLVENGGLETYQISSVEDFGSSGEVHQEQNPGDQLESWNSVQQDNYNIIQTEDGLFSVTATVLNLESEGGDVPGQSLVQTASDKFEHIGSKPVEETCDGKTKATEISSGKQVEGNVVRKRSRTREVNIPSRYKDFDTMPQCKRVK